MSTANWVQVNEDGFGYPLSSSAQGGTGLFTFGGHLYAYNEHGLFRMDNLVCRVWEKVFTPADSFRPLGDYLYCMGLKELWWIKQGEEFSNVNWKQVTSQGLPGGANPWPRTIFKDELYGVYHHYDSTTGTKTFEIWCSKDIGKTIINWQPVVTNSFDDPQNNKGVDFMGVFNGKIYAGTETLEGNFGSPQLAAGVEIWESSTGDAGTWAQVNIDGFGTETMVFTNQKKIQIRTNHVIGSWAVYKAPNQSQEYLYIGTKSHWGAEVWRYDGQGKGGWKNVTPPWAGPSLLGDVLNSGRNESMIIFQGNLFLAEGYYTGNLAKYDGNNWTIAVSGPNPFDPQNGGLSSLAVFENNLYVHTLHNPYSGATKGDQVWGYPFNFIAWKFACSVKSLLFWWPRLIWRWVTEFRKK